jgi:hypothetical protein
VSGEVICERYRDAWGAKLALVLFLLATLACIAFASPWLVVADSIEIVMTMQVGTIFVITLLASLARRLRLPWSTIIGDALVLWLSLGAG